MTMWSESDIRTELEDAKKVRNQCRELGDVGQAVYWSGYARALEVVLNEGEVNGQTKYEIAGS